MREACWTEPRELRPGPPLRKRAKFNPAKGTWGKPALARPGRHPGAPKTEGAPTVVTAAPHERKLRHKKAKELAQDHMTTTGQSWDSKPRSSPTRADTYPGKGLAPTLLPHEVALSKSYSSSINRAASCPRVVGNHPAHRHRQGPGRALPIRLLCISLGGCGVRTPPVGSMSDPCHAHLLISQGLPTRGSIFGINH